jgi:hypothetical protein
VYVSLTEAPKDRAAYAALFFGVFWGSWACAAVWMLLTYWRGSLSITESQLYQQGAISNSGINLAAVDDARWKIPKRGRIVLRTPGKHNWRPYFAPTTAF